MMIRKAQKKDIPALERLLQQVLMVHHNGRPDLFSNTNKYTEKELEEILQDDEKPVLVYEEDGEVLGYCFGMIQTESSNNLQELKTLYIDDLCVEEGQRKKGIGTKLLKAMEELAKSENCYHITLNVWAFNDTAERFYRDQGLKPLKTYLEKIIK